MDFRWSGLHVRCENFCVVSEVLVEGVAVPTPFDLYYVEWKAAKEVF